MRKEVRAMARVRAIVLAYAGTKEHQNNHHMILKPLDLKGHGKAAGLIGRRVVWKSPTGRKLFGRVVRKHGNGDRIRVYFKRGLPGQALGDYVEIL
jgi:large subunit ribosomal protein L35Ae